MNWMELDEVVHDQDGRVGRRESNHNGVLTARNLLILRYGKTAKNARNAEARYTAGTRAMPNPHLPFTALEKTSAGLPLLSWPSRLHTSR